MNRLWPPWLRYWLLSPHKVSNIFITVILSRKALHALFSVYSLLSQKQSIRFYLVNTRMRSKPDIKMVGCVRAVLGIVGGGVTFRFLNGDAIPDENMPFFIRLYALVVPLKTIPDFRL